MSTRAERLRRLRPAKPRGLVEGSTPGSLGGLLPPPCLPFHAPGNSRPRLGPPPGPPPIASLYLGPPHPVHLVDLVHLVDPVDPVDRVDPVDPVNPVNPVEPRPNLSDSSVVCLRPSNRLLVPRDGGPRDRAAERPRDRAACRCLESHS
jgi:hypothetical protein